MIHAAAIAFGLVIGTFLAILSIPIFIAILRISWIVIGGILIAWALINWPH